MSMKNNEVNVFDSGVAELNNSSTPRTHRATLKFPTKLRNTLAAMGLVCSENCEFIGPLGNVQGTGFGKVNYHFKSRSFEVSKPINSRFFTGAERVQLHFGQFR